MHGSSMLATLALASAMAGANSERPRGGVRVGVGRSAAVSYSEIHECP